MFNQYWVGLLNRKFRQRRCEKCS